MARALTLGIAATIFRDRIWRLNGDPLALFPGDSDKPVVTKAEGRRISSKNLFKFLPQLKLDIPILSSLTGEVLVMHDSQLFISVDPWAQDSNTFHQVAMTLEGNSNPTAGPYDLLDWYGNMSNRKGCEYCTRYEPNVTGLKQAWKLPLEENIRLAQKAALARMERQRNLPQQPILIRDKQQEQVRLKLPSDGHDDDHPVQLQRRLKGK